MNIVEKEAIKFIDDLYNAGDHNRIEDLKSRIDSKLYYFNRDRDKLDFLKILRASSIDEQEKHEETCDQTNCGFSIARKYGIFLIVQEIDSINNYYDFEPKPKDKFSSDEETLLHVKLNEILNKLDKQGYGQEILFEEIESLKNHFNLGKRNWFQLLKGKLIDLTIEKVLEESIVKEIYNGISDGFNEVSKLLQ
jgi:hypothetical protein